MKRSKRDGGKIDTIIGPHTYIEGTLSSNACLRIDGRVKGRIECEGSLVIGPEAKVEAEIVAENVYIAGELIGNVLAKSRLEIIEKGKVYGDITTAKLVVDQDVIFEGRCHMTTREDTAESADYLALPTPLARSH